MKNCRTTTLLCYAICAMTSNTQTWGEIDNSSLLEFSETVNENLKIKYIPEGISVLYGADFLIATREVIREANISITDPSFVKLKFNGLLGLSATPIPGVNISGLLGLVGKDIFHISLKGVILANFWIYSNFGLALKLFARTYIVPESQQFLNFDAGIYLGFFWKINRNSILNITVSRQGLIGQFEKDSAIKKDSGKKTDETEIGRSIGSFRSSTQSSAFMISDYPAYIISLEILQIVTQIQGK